MLKFQISTRLSPTTPTTCCADLNMDFVSKGQKKMVICLK